NLREPPRQENYRVAGVKITSLSAVFSFFIIIQFGNFLKPGQKLLYILKISSAVLTAALINGNVHTGTVVGLLP
ncbi:MAG: hypothetical protein PVJ01_07540, partial [Pseudomonadota bacterium]